MSDSIVATPPAPAPAATPPAVERRPSWLLAVIGVVLVALYLPTLVDLAWAWYMDPNYSHGFLILPISVGIAWWIFREHPIPASGEVGLGAGLMAFGLALHLACVVLRYPPIDLMSILLVLRGLALVLGGTEWANRFLFPTFFLFFLFPLPHQMTTELAIWLQRVVTSISTEVFSWFYNCFQRGNAIFFRTDPPATVLVGEECSGVRQLMAFVAMGALVGYIGKLDLVRAAALVALSIPVAIFANVVRVLVMGVVIIYFGDEWLKTWKHHIPAMFTIALGIATNFGLLWLISPDETPPKPSPVPGDAVQEAKP